MNAIPLPLIDGDTLLIDNSSLERFSTCPRSAEYALCRQLKPTGEKSALKFGGIIHKLLELRYRAGESMYAQSPTVEKAMLELADEEFNGKTTIQPDGTLVETPGWSPPEDDFRTYSTAIGFIKRYGEDYPFEPFDIVKFPDGKPFIEVPFALPLGIVGNVKVIWTGRIDLAYMSNGALYGMDHKTTSVMGPSYFSTFEISHQLYGYAWALEQILGTQVAGFVINALGIRRPTPKGKPFEFTRQLIPIQRGLLAEWKTDCLHLVADYIEMARRGYYPKATAWCVGKFGECPFKKVCTLDSADQREVMLSSGEFEKNTWSPLT